MNDLVIRGDGFDVAITDGVIAEIGPELAGGREEIDAGGLRVMAGGVDPHVHLDDPGRTEWEGWGPGTTMLAAGGMTTCIDMPLNSSPVTVDVESFDLKVAAAQGVAEIDFALWGGLVPGRVGELEAMAAAGVVGFKAFMSESGLNDFPAADDLTLLEGMAEAARLGLPVAVHAESDTITRGLAQRLQAAGRHGIADWAASRPAIAEIEAVRRAIGLAEETGCALHVVHLSTGGAVALVAEARAVGLDVSCEVCTHHLLLTDEDAERLGAVAKCAPPLRPRQQVDAIWAGLERGDVDWVCSDHSPAPPEMKTGDDAFAWWGGIAGGQSTLELLLTEAPELDAERLLGAAAARRVALPGKGRLEVGADADLALVELGPERVLAAGELRQRHPISPFVGRTLTARVRRTLLRGVPVGEGSPPRGELQKPSR